MSIIVKHLAQDKNLDLAEIYANNADIHHACEIIFEHNAKNEQVNISMGLLIRFFLGIEGMASIFNLWTGTTLRNNVFHLYKHWMQKPG